MSGTTFECIASLILFLFVCSHKAFANIDSICENIDQLTSINAITKFANASIFIFVGTHFWHLNALSGVHSKLNISDYFSDLLDQPLDGTIDAISTDIRQETTFLFKKKYFWVIDNKFVASPHLRIRSYFPSYDFDYVDAALVATNPKYDGFNHFDFIYLFKGDSMWQFEFYFVSNELFIEHDSYRKLSLAKVSVAVALGGRSPLNNGIDAAFNDGQYIYLFKDSKQFKTETINFPDKMDGSKLSSNSLLTGVINCKNEQTHERNLFIDINSLSHNLIVSIKKRRIHTFLSEIQKLFFLSLMISGVICIVLVSFVVCKRFVLFVRSSNLFKFDS